MTGNSAARNPELLVLVNTHASGVADPKRQLATSPPCSGNWAPPRSPWSHPPSESCGTAWARRRSTDTGWCWSAGTARCMPRRMPPWPRCPSSRSSRPGGPTTSPARSASPPNAAARCTPRPSPPPGRSTRCSSHPATLAVRGRGGQRGLPGRCSRELRRRELRRPASGRTGAGRRTAALQALRHPRPRGRFRARLEPAAQLFLSNLRYFGYGFDVAPGADPRDGLFDAILIDAPGRLSLVRLLVATRRGRHLTRPGVRRVSGRRAELTEPLPLVADAEPLGTTTATVSVQRARLRVASPGPGGVA